MDKKELLRKLKKLEQNNDFMYNALRFILPTSIVDEIEDDNISPPDSEDDVSIENGCRMLGIDDD